MDNLKTIYLIYKNENYLTKSKISEFILKNEKMAESIAKMHPMKRLGEPEEIGNFVKGIIENKVKYLSGVTINFDGANSNYIF